MILVSFQDIPSETIQTKIFTKIRQSQTTLRRKKVTKKIHERDWRLHHNNVSMIIKCLWKCHSELVMLSMLQLYPLDSKRAKVSIVFKWQTALSPFGWFLLNPSKEKHSSNKQVIYDQIFTIIKWNMRFIWLIIFFFFFFANWHYKYRAETSLWLLYMQNWIGLHWRQYRISSRCKRNSHTRPERTHAPTLPFGPTLCTWKSSNSSPCRGRLYSWVWSEPMARVYTAGPVLPTGREQISPLEITNSIRGNLV